MPTYEELQAENKALKSQVKTNSVKIEELEKLNDWYIRQLKLNRKKMFGASSEKSEHADSEQLNLFNEAEAERPLIAAEPTVESISHTPKKKKGSRKKLLKQLPVEVVEYVLAEGEQICPNCDNSLHSMTKEVRREFKIIPAELSVIEHVSYVYACRNCEKNGITTPIITADAPKALVPKSLVSPSVMAYIMNQKFANAMPLYRQEQEFKRLGILLSRQNLSNWVIKGASLLLPLQQSLKQELLKQDLLHADETTLEVLCEPDRAAEMKSYMWLYRTSGDTSRHVVLYDYQMGRSGKFAADYLKDFRGFLHCDGFGGYRKLEEQGVTLCGCWAHARRKFHDALKASGATSQTSLPQVGLDFCNQLFELQKAKNLALDEENSAKIREEQKELVLKFYLWIEENSNRILPKSHIGEALTYAVNQKKYLIAFLQDDRIELSNNRAERSIKPFVIGRKNWLFCNTPGGATSSAIIYSIIQSAIENGLKPAAYLEYVFSHIQKFGKDNIEGILPWAKGVRLACSVSLEG